VTTSLLLAWFGTLLGLVRTIPQLLVTRREQNLSGLSVIGCLGVFVSMLWWCIYAFLVGDIFLAVSSVGATIPPLLIWGVLSRKRLATTTHQAYLVVGIAVGVVSGFIGFNVVGLLASSSTVLYAVPQFWRVAKTRNVQGISVSTWVLTGINTSVWAAYGVREHLLPTVLPALLLLPTAFPILVLKARDHRHGGMNSLRGLGTHL
jgi:uncharacterized protein with PQ loop repeat